ncbi:MAG: DUF1934 domain-containing protein [Eubacteriales bacterium]
MNLSNERLPCEEAAVPAAADEKTVRLTLTAQHKMTRALGPGMSMFDDDGADEYGEELPEGFSPDAIADYDAPDDGEYDDGYDDAEEDDASAAEELYRRLEELADRILSGDNGGDEEGTYVFKTLARMRRTADVDGCETIELEYTEDDSMENTRTVLAFTPSQNNRVSIIHNGPVMSSLVCERGVRHISAYTTPVMPFEVAVYAKKCDGTLTFDGGGSLELDYLVELRGMDVQRTRMTIDVICLDE